MTRAQFTLPSRRVVLCDGCGRRVASDRVRVVERKVLCDKCRKEAKDAAGK